MGAAEVHRVTPSYPVSIGIDTHCVLDAPTPLLALEAPKNLGMTEPCAEPEQSEQKGRLDRGGLAVPHMCGNCAAQVGRDQEKSDGPSARKHEQSRANYFQYPDKHKPAVLKTEYAKLLQDHRDPGELGDGASNQHEPQEIDQDISRAS